MQLGNQVEWALHCCSVLASAPADAFLSTKVLAEFHGVPKEYLSKALQSLAQAGLVETALGPTGGYRLKRPPREISFLDIVEAVEGPRATFRCTEIRRNNPCRKKSQRDKNACAVARAMYKADEAWRNELRSVTLEGLGRQLAVELDPVQVEKNAAWISSR
jgi:Rrf2 family protein